MKLPQNYNEIKPANEMNRHIAAGGYIAQIIDYEDYENRQYLKLYIDIAEGDYAGFFKESYNRAKSYDVTAKWNNAGIIYRSYSINALPYFKGMMTAIEDSNKGYIFNPDNLEELKGKYVGIVYADEEYRANNGAVKVSCKPRFTCSTERIKSGDYTVPQLKKLEIDTIDHTAYSDNFDYSDYNNAELPF